MNPYYKDYNEYLGEHFPGIKVQKISVNAGFTCPNRDGTIGRGGCIYCDNSSFTPSYCFESDSVTEQIEKGKRFFSGKYPRMKYLVYFQSFSNTFGSSVENLEKLYREAAYLPDVVGLIIGTRPDCVPENVIDLLDALNRETKVFVELGAETSWDDTLRLINRGHLWDTTVDAVGRLAMKNIPTGLHLIMGLPGESEQMMLQTVRRAVSLPVDSLKFHHLQILRGTHIEQLWKERQDMIYAFNIESYVELCVKIIKLVPRNIAIERFLASSPPEKVIVPKWGMKNYQFINILHNQLVKIKTGKI